jgi:hypothetical protein
MLLHCNKSSQKVVKLRVTHPRCLKNEQVMHIIMLRIKNTQKNSLINWARMNIILFMHEQMFNDPWPNPTYLLHIYIGCNIRKNKKRHKNCSSLISMNMITRNFFSINGDGSKREKNLDFYTCYWPLLFLPPPTSTKIFFTFSFFGT